MRVATPSAPAKAAADTTAPEAPKTTIAVTAAAWRHS